MLQRTGNQWKGEKSENVSGFDIFNKLCPEGGFVSFQARRQSSKIPRLSFSVCLPISAVVIWGWGWWWGGGDLEYLQGVFKE